MSTGSPLNYRSRRSVVEHLAATGLSSAAISRYLGFSPQKLSILLGGPNEFDEAVKEGRRAGRAIVTAALYKNAAAGDPVAQIHILEALAAQGRA